MRNLKDVVRRIFRSPMKKVKRAPYLFRIDSSATILDSTRFDFRVSRNTSDPCIYIGQASMIGCSFIFESGDGRIRIGDRTFVNAGTKLISRSSIEIGSDVTIGWGCYIYDHDSHSLDWNERRLDIERQIHDYYQTGNMLASKDWSVVNSKPIKICDKAWVGFEAVILKGVTIGEGAVVGARSVVTRDVAPWTIVAGNPAREIKKVDEKYTPKE